MRQLVICSGRSNSKVYLYLYIEISIDGSFVLPKAFPIINCKNLLLYYLYCLCKSIQIIAQPQILFFSESNAKVRTFKYILQIFSEVFFHLFSLSSSSLLSKGKRKRKKNQAPFLLKECQLALLSFSKAGAKVTL